MSVSIRYAMLPTAALLFVISSAASAKQNAGPVYTMSDVANTDPSLSAKFTNTLPESTPVDSDAYGPYRTGSLTDTIIGRLYVRFKTGGFAPCYDAVHPEIPAVFAIPAMAYSGYLLNRYAYDVAKTGKYAGTLGASVDAPWWLSDSGTAREHGSLVRASACSPSGDFVLHVSPGSWFVYGFVEAHRTPSIVVRRQLGGETDDGEEQVHVDLPSETFAGGFTDAFFVLGQPARFDKPGETFTEQKAPLVIGHFDDR